ncbi:hypothetical protein DEU56DRAFT_823769 [Suillus clintonianus]|uniref:uncharacterized protein n=1 Tax=Suillus clintonianus TaxID=1904413 RepID=UPI001B85E1A6|nr:uncharacterized protein DEU56DRAFT_823769 [Suillus clintonianus]KAG2125790.1 hypothetical protein DEU56DRAFT_823769 [Suillus clintonianus]
MAKTTLITYSQVAVGKSLINSNVGRRPDQIKDAHRLPRGFFDDARDGVQSSATRGTHTHFSAHRTLTPSGSPRALLDRISLPFGRSQPSEIEIEMQQHPKPSATSRGDPSTIEVANVPDEQASLVPQPERHRDKAKQTQQQDRSQGQALALPSHSRSAATSRPPAYTASPTTLGAAGTRSQTALVIRKPTRWTRFLLRVCCVAAEPADGY